MRRLLLPSWRAEPYLKYVITMKTKVVFFGDLEQLYQSNINAYLFLYRNQMHLNHELKCYMCRPAHSTQIADKKELPSVVYLCIGTKEVLWILSTHNDMLGLHKISASYSFIYIAVLKITMQKRDIHCMYGLRPSKKCMDFGRRRIIKITKKKLLKWLFWIAT